MSESSSNCQKKWEMKKSNFKLVNKKKMERKKKRRKNTIGAGAPKWAQVSTNERV
jgi:hypothetical protein